MPYYHKKYTEEEKTLDAKLCNIMMAMVIITTLICGCIELVQQLYA